MLPSRTAPPDAGTPGLEQVVPLPTAIVVKLLTTVLGPLAPLT
jgi:hypothetical protein